MGLFTEQEVYDMLMLLFTCVFINVTPEHGWALNEGGAQVSEIINGLIEKSYNSVNSLLPPVRSCSSLATCWYLRAESRYVCVDQEEAMARLPQAAF